MLHVVAEIEQDVGGEEDIGEGTVAADPFPSFNAVTSDDNSAMVVKVNTQRLEQYLQSIREKLSNYEAAMHEQHEILNKLSKADETKIAKLSVKLDHCIIDVNTFKDFVLSRQVSSSDLDAIGSKCNFAETKSDHKYMISQLQSEVSALSLMVRRIELSQAEGLDSFAQIKQLNSALKLVTKELDSLGKNSVILELREHVDRVVLSIRNDIQQAADQREADIQEVRQSFSSLEEDRLAMMEQRLQVIEEKAILYDMVLSEQEGVAGAEGDDGGELNSERNDNLLLSEKVGFAGMEAITEDGEPLRPSQMLLRGISDVGFAEDDDGSGGPPSPNAINTDSAAASAAAGATTEVAGAVVRLGSGIFQNMSSKSSVKGGRANRSLTTDGFAGRGAVVQSFTFAGSGRYSSGGSSQKSQKHQQQGVGSREREGSFAVGSIGGGGKRGRESALKRSSFFTNLLGQYVSRENHEQDLDAERAFAQAGIFGLQKQLKVLAAGRMGGVLSRALRDIVRWKVRHCFTQLVSNVQSWHTVRNRRNRSKALMFQVRLHSLTSKRILRMGLEYWRRVTWLFRERERLKLWLRTKLQHWLNMKIPNVKLYLNRWKRFTVHSYYSSLFVEDEGEDETTAISDDFQRLLNSDNFSVSEVKRIAHDDMKRRWAQRARQERLLLQQENAIRDHVHKVTMAITGGTFPGFEGAVSAADFAALQSKCAAMEEGLCTVRLDLRRAMNEQADSDATVDAKIEAECRKVTSELSIFRSQVAVRFNDCKEGLLALQADMRTQFEAERKRMVRVEDHLKIIERRLDGEQSRVAPLVAEQQRMQSLLDGMKSELRCTDTQLGALHGQIDRALGASTNTVESNKRMERTLAENAEYYDVELKFMRTHVTDTVASLAAMKAEKRTFVESVESRIEVMLNDLNNFVERLPLPRELFDVCVEYEGMWVRLHSEGIEGTAELQSLPDKLHNKVSQLALRIAHHIAAAADRLVLARWTAGSTAKKATTNPQEAPKLFPVHGGAPGVASSGVKSGSSNGQQRESVLTELQPESAAASGGAGAGAGVSPMLEGDHLTENMQVKVSFNMPSADLIEQVRDELFQNYLSTGFIALLRASDEALGPPGLLKSTGRATFQRKLKKAVEAALTKYPVMLDPAQASQAAALSLARSSKKQQLARFTSHTGQAVSLPKRLNTEFDTCVSCGHELAAQLHLAQSQQQQAQALVPDCSTTNNGMPVLQELIRPYSGIIRPPPINTDYSITYHINNNNNIHSTPSMASLVVPSHSPVQHPPPFGQLRRQDTPATPLDLFGSLDEGSSSDELNQQAQSQPGRPASPLSRISVTLTKKARPHSGTAPATATFASISNNARDSNNTEWSKLQSARSNKRPASASAALRHREAVKDAMRQQEQAEQQQLDMHNKVERGKIEQTFHHPAGVAAHLDHTGSECSDYDGRGAELQKAAAAVPRTGPDVSPSGSTAGMRGANPNLGKSTPSIPAHVRGFGGSAGGGSGTATSKSQSHSNSNFGTSPNMRTAGRESTALMHPVTAAVPSSVAAAPSSAVTSSATTGRAGSGFGMPVQPSQQGSNILAHQLAHRFQQDASFHGTAMRQVDSTDLLEPIQISRKLFGAHQ